ncbi:MAG: F0F1 ATP synthase subunit B [bacterium]
MEALESLGIDWRLLIAQIINFLILLFLLRFFLYKPIVGMLIKRKEKISQGLKDAQDAKEQLEQASAKSKQTLTEASLVSEKIISSAKREMEEQTGAEIKRAQLKAEEILASSRKQAALEQAKIVEKAKREITDLALTISEKVIGSQVDKDDIKKVSEKIK